MASTASKTKVMLAATLGSMLEWYDFFIFAACTVLVFNKTFFPSDNEFVSTMLGLGTFAAGFLARPFGGIIFGVLGDKVGRKKTLIISLLMMGISTVAIGFLPTYASIGIAAPLLLLLIRIIQGIAVGGEATGALTIVVESMSKRNRGFWSGFPIASGPAANVLGLAILGLVQGHFGEQVFVDWAWRIPFLLSVVLILLGFWARRQVEESPAFVEMKKEHTATKTPLIETFRNYKTTMLRVFFVKAAENTFLYLFSTFVLLMATARLGLSRGEALTIVWHASAFSLPVILFAGWLGDRIGRRPVMMLGFIGAIIASFLLFTVQTGDDPSALQLRAIFALCSHGFLLGGLGAFVTEIFPTRVRYTALSTSYQAASVLGGSIAPIIGELLVHQTGNPVSVAIYASLMAIPAFIVLFITPETRQVDLDHDYR